ncbi:MAG TPA: DUF1838 family protein [Steroidobacteraceae bacterium]|nr:DUF1838 family protein [Steroidobacteraceae bacterium]
MAKVMSPMPEGFKAGPLDLTKPLDNLVALLKLQADLSGAPVMSGLAGQAWGWVPNDKNYLLFNTYGIGCSRLEFSPQENGFRLYHREVLYYLDPKSGEVLQTWQNPMTGQTVEVLHIMNDPVNRLYPLSGGRFAPPYPHTVVGDDLVFQLDVLRAEPMPMPRAQYPLHAQQDVYQSGELWAIQGRMSEINDPKVTSASCHTAWARIGMWLPFMEMGNRPGQMVYHSQSFKLKNGAAGLPPKIREYTEKNHPKYLEAPQEWLGLTQNENTWTYSKKVIDERRAAGKVVNGSVFGVYK